MVWVKWSLFGYFWLGNDTKQRKTMSWGMIAILWMCNTVTKKLPWDVMRDITVNNNQNQCKPVHTKNNKRPCTHFQVLGLKWETIALVCFTEYRSHFIFMEFKHGNILATLNYTWMAEVWCCLFFDKQIYIYIRSVIFRSGAS